MKTFNRISSGAAGLVFLLVILAAAYILIANFRIRADLTEEQLFTLSRGSRDLVGKLDQDVTLKFYFSKSSANVPIYLKNYARQVQDFLREYELAGKGRLILEAYDPKPDSDIEEWAQKFGVAPQTVAPFAPPLYFGLVAVCNGREAAIPVFSPTTERTLEYEVSRLIARAAWPEKPVIGVMSGTLNALGDADDPMQKMMGRNQQQQQKPWAVFAELKRDYAVRAVNTASDTIDNDITTLILVHPKNLTEQTLFAIDQFVLRGGRLLACLDPFSIQDFRTAQGAANPMMGMQGPDAPGPSTLGKLLDAWGVGFDTAKVLADTRAITRLDGGNGQIDENPVVLSFTSQNTTDDVLTAQLNQLIFPFAGTFTDNTTKDLTFTPLITSSEKAGKVDTMVAQYGTAMLRGQLSIDGLKHPVAIRLAGTFKTAFPDGAPAAAQDDDAAAKAEQPKVEGLTTGQSTVVLVGDSDFLADGWSVRNVTLFFGYQATEAVNDNIALLANAAEQLSGRSELIAVRSRGNSTRPFTVVDRLESKALEQWSEKEKALQAKLNETRTRIQQLQSQQQGKQQLILSPDQEQAITGFREEERKTNRALKNLRRDLNADIENLGIHVKVVNIAMMPALIVLVSLVRGLGRRRRR